MKEVWSITDAEIEMVDFAVNKCIISYMLHSGLDGWMLQNYPMWDEFIAGTRTPFAIVIDKYKPVLDAEIKKI